MKQILTKFAIFGLLCFGPVNATNARVCFNPDFFVMSTAYSSFDFWVIAYNQKTSTFFDIWGIGLCTSAESVRQWNSLNNDAGTNGINQKNCWCKVTVPFNTSWYLAYKADSSTDCSDNCTQKCLELIQTPGFWTTAYDEEIKLS